MNHTPLRANVRDHLYSFKRYSEQRVYYLNVALINTVPSYLKKVNFDLIIFHTLFLTYHIVQGDTFKKLINKVQYFKFSDAIKIALPQDEHTNSGDLEIFYKEFGINHVFSVAPENQLPILYPTTDFGKIKFHTVLTGYIDPKTLERILRMSEKQKHKDIDVFYKTGKISPALGRHGVLKSDIADIFNSRLEDSSLNVSISNDPRTIIIGDDWYKFLVRSKYTIGIEGGSSVLDYDGSIRDKVKLYLKEKPDAAFEDIEKACFPGMDGKLQYFAVSPRHIEATITKTCQILVEGDYNGILKKDIHYIELKKDLSNIDEVIQLIKKDSIRIRVIEKAYNDIVKSGKYTYDNFVTFVTGTSLSNIQPRKHNNFESILYLLNCTFEYSMQLLIIFNSFINKCFGLSQDNSIFKELKKIFK